MKLLLIDNFDSFTFNIVQSFQSLGVDISVLRSNQANIKTCLAFVPTKLVIGPGPGSPEQAITSLELIKLCPLPILGICLGHQCIAHFFGAKVIKARYPMHGKLSAIHHDGKTIFKEMPKPFLATRYHSLIVEEATLPDCLEVSARTECGEIMALRHRELPIESVQFHPESCLTQKGNTILSNFIKQEEKTCAI